MNDSKSNNPQREEIRRAQKNYEPSDELKAKLARLGKQRRQFIDAVEAGEIPEKAYYDFGSFDAGVKLVVPTELDMMATTEEYEMYLDKQRWIRQVVRFREGNTFVEVDSRFNDIFNRDPDANRRLFYQLKEKLYDRSYAELIGDDLGGLLAKPLAEPMESGLIGIKFAENGAYFQVRIWIGYPYSQGSHVI